MRRKWGEILRTVTVTAVAVGLVSATGAVAAGELTGKDIENGSITSKDVKNLTLKDFKKKVRKKLNTGGPQGEQGPQGDQGPAGEDGQDGAPGTPGGVGNAVYSNPQWGVMTRNTIGSPDVELRGGPFVGADEAPPFGDGSLGMSVNGQPRVASANDAEQATFGNEVDFLGVEVGSISEIGFYAYTTGENNAKGTPNMPSIKIEIDPNLETSASNFSTLQFMPANTASNVWSDYIDGTSVTPGPGGPGWFMSGAAGTETGCSLSTPCSFQDMQDGLDDGGTAATIYTVAIGKGRDYSWAGAVDGLTINDTLYDFEPFGVEEGPVPAP